MKNKLIVLFIITLSFLGNACAQEVDLSFYSPPSEKTPYPVVSETEVNNIILLIGDGMGITHICAAQIKIAGADGLLYLQRLPFTGFQKTYSADRLITDSAASATALATGHKTKNHMISMAPDSTKLQTILETAQHHGLATGLVATSSVTHATPAGFGAHVVSRYMETDIAKQLIQNQINVLLGAGKSFFLPEGVENGKREDGRNLIDEAQKAGYHFIETKDQLNSVSGDFILGLFADEAMTTQAPEPTLREMTQKAIQTLQQDEDGFFLMVEGSQIDWEAHDNKGEAMIRQLLLFDEAVKAAMDFALDDKHTLIVVTADHETGGLAINGGNLQGSQLQLKWTSKDHTGVVVPVFAFGPQAEKFTGLHNNTDIPRIFADLLGFEDFEQKRN